MKIYCKLGNSVFVVDTASDETIGSLKKKIKDENTEDLASVDAGKLVLARVFEVPSGGGVPDGGVPEDGAPDGGDPDNLISDAVPEGPDGGVRNGGVPDDADLSKLERKIHSAVSKRVDVEKYRPRKVKGEVPGWHIQFGIMAAKVMSPTYKLSRYSLTNDTHEGCVDILVILPAAQNKERPSSACSTYSTSSILSLSQLKRKSRWDSLNAISDGNKKAKVEQPGEETSTGYSYISWKEVEPVFEPLIKEYTQLTLAVPDEEFNFLYNNMIRITKCYGYVIKGKEAKRQYFISPILVCVSYLFNGDIQILVQEDLEGNNIHVHGHFEYVLKRGDKRICIVEAMQEQMNQGKAQNLLGCEAVADVDGLSCVYGIVTNFIEWRFYKSTDDDIFEDFTTLKIDDHHLPSKNSLRCVVGKIYAILKD
ncbi:hypothetical protein HK098_006409, partial [Nowakowskiella sp. JEL0407]